MRNKKVAFLILTILLLVVPASPQTKQFKALRDYFMLLPDKYFVVACYPNSVAPEQIANLKRSRLSSKRAERREQ
jgi:hypothetical protein